MFRALSYTQSFQYGFWDTLGCSGIISSGHEVTRNNLYKNADLESNSGDARAQRKSLKVSYISLKSLILVKVCYIS